MGGFTDGLNLVGFRESDNGVYPYRHRSTRHFEE